MSPRRSPRSRYLITARRAHVLRRLAAGGFVVLVPAACSTSDAEVFSQATQAPPASAPATAGTTATTGSPSPTEPLTVAPTTTTPTTVAATEPSTTTGDATSTGRFPAGAEMVVGFTYAPSSTGGRIENPYIAVWVEDPDGNLVTTISLWYLQSDKGTRWLDELRGWADTGAEPDATTSGATRPAGSYTVAWDGTDLDGNPVPAGDYVLFVEAAREHGPYEITSATVTVGAGDVDVTLPDNGELTALSAVLTA